MSAEPRPVTNHPTLRLCSTCAAVAPSHLVRDRGQLYAVCLVCLACLQRSQPEQSSSDAD